MNNQEKTLNMSEKVSNSTVPFAEILCITSLKKNYTNDVIRRLLNEQFPVHVSSDVLSQAN